MGILLFLAATLCYAGLALYFAKPKSATSISPFQPVVIVYAVIGFWSLAAAPSTEFPLQSILGGPQNAQGALWYLAIGALIACAILLLDRPKLFASLLGLVMSAAVAAAALNLRRVEWFYEWAADYVSFPNSTLLHFNEYQAYFAVGLFPICAIFLASKRKGAGYVVGMVALIALMVSRNRSAMLAALLVPILIAWRRHEAFRSAGTRLAGRIGGRGTLALLAAVLCGAAIAPYAVVRVLPLQQSNGSFWSRQIVFRAVEPSLFDAPGAILFGHGWSNYGEYLLRNVVTTGVSLVHSEWQGLARDVFHSHSAALEALFSAGMPGLVLVLILPVVLVWYANARWKDVAVCYALAWTLVDSFWFMMPATACAMALGVAIVSDRTWVPRWQPKTSWAVAGCAVLAVMNLVAAIVLAQFAGRMTGIDECLKAKTFDPSCAARSIPSDPRGTAQDLASLLADDAPPIIEKLPHRSAAQIDMLRRTLATAQTISAQGSSTFLPMALANVWAMIAFAHSDTVRLMPDDTLARAWPAAIRHVLDRAPSRLDVLPLYLNWALLNQRTDDFNRMLTYAVGRDPGHPVAMWFTGLALIESPEPLSRERGISLMRQAVDRGLERYMKIDDKIRSALGLSSGPN